MAIRLKEKNGKSTCTITTEANRIAFKLVNQALGQAPSTLLFMGVSNAEIVSRCIATSTLSQAEALVVAAALSNSLVLSSEDEHTSLVDLVSSLNLNHELILDISSDSHYPIMFNECEVISVSSDEA